jgi:hypothetical protein
VVNIGFEKGIIWISDVEKFNKHFAACFSLAGLESRLWTVDCYWERFYLRYGKGFFVIR